MSAEPSPSEPAGAQVIPWWKFWNPQSGEKGGALAGLIIAALLLLVLHPWTW